MNNEKGKTIYKESYINRYNILIDKNTETPGPGDYQIKDLFRKR